MKKKKKPGAQRQGKQVKKVCSVRIEPRVKKKLVKKYKGFQKAFDKMIEKENL